MQLPVFTFCLATTPASHQCLPKSSWRTAWTFYSSAVFSPDQSSEEFKLFWLNFKINDVLPLSILRNVTKKHNFSRQGRLKMFPQGCSFREWTPLDIMFQQMFLLSSKQEVLRLEHKSVIMYLQGVIDFGHNDTLWVWGDWYAEGCELVVIVRRFIMHWDRF